MRYTSRARVLACTTLLAVSLCAIRTAAQVIKTAIAETGIGKRTDMAKDSATGKTNNPKAMFTLGENSATAGGVNKVAGPLMDLYLNPACVSPCTVEASIAGGNNADALSTMTLTPGQPKGWVDWAMLVKATAGKNAPLPNSKASAAAMDPQFFDPASFPPNPIYAEDISLLAGSSIFESDPTTSASSYFERDTSLALQNSSCGLSSNLIFSITLAEDASGNPLPAVLLSCDPNITFTDPTTGNTTTAAAIEAALQSAPGLWTSTGLTSDLALFNYSFNLSSFSVTSSDNVSAVESSNASSGSGQDNGGPTLPQWAAIAMGLVLVILSIFKMRRLNPPRTA